MRRFSVAVVVAVSALASAAHADSIEAKAQICAACHGDNGIPAKQAFPVPVIWGQNLGYLFFELRDFKSGARKNEQMTPIAHALNQADLMPLATYFSKKTWPRLMQPQPTAAQTKAAERVNASVVCTSCHQQGFLGAGTQPRLAGQERAYLQKTMKDFQTGARANNPGMSSLMRSVSDPDIAALAAWLAAM